VCESSCARTQDVGVSMQSLRLSYPVPHIPACLTQEKKRIEKLRRQQNTPCIN